MGFLKDPYEAIRKLKKKFREQEGDIFGKEVDILTASGKPAGRMAPLERPGKKAPVAKVKKVAAPKKPPKKAGKKKARAKPKKKAPAPKRR